MNNQTSHEKDVERFWKQYNAALYDSGVKQNEIEWHIKKAEYYIKHARKVRLKDQSSEDVVFYLNPQGYIIAGKSELVNSTGKNMIGLELPHK